MSPEARRTPADPFLRIDLGTVPSTQDEARARARAGARSGSLVIAETQTAGRGRGGHSWESAPGLGLWMTLIHRSGRGVAEWPIFTSAGSLAVCEAIGELGLEPGILWPNDLVISGRKVCGILAETEADAVLIGIGVNLHHGPLDFPAELRGSATSIAIELSRIGRIAPDREGFLGILTRSLASVLDQVESGGSSAIVPRLWARSVVRGRRVDLRTSDPSAGETIRGEAIGLNEVGGLIVRGSAGTVELVSGTLVRVDPEER